MRVIELGDVDAAGFFDGANLQASPPGDYIGFAIGPDSSLPLCKVEGLTLAPGRVLPIRVRGVPRVEPVGSVRSRDAGVPLLADQYEGRRLQLLAFECGDQLINPGRRPPLTVVGDTGAAEGSSSAATARRLRLPFAGRVRAQFVCQYHPNLGTDADFHVYGIRYRDRVALGKATQEGDHREPFIARLTATVQNTTGAADAGAGTTAYELALITYEGGTDSAEGFDELELWATLNGGSGYIRTQATAWDPGDQ